MAGMEFNADDLPVIKPEDISKEQILANLPSSQEKNRIAEKILERFIRDFDKSVQKKSLALNTRVERLSKRGAPRTDDVSELDKFVDSMVEQQRSLVSQMNVQMEKEFDNIRTRLETSTVATDFHFSQIEAFRDTLSAQIDEIVNKDLDEAGKEVRERGKEAILKRGEKKAKKSAAQAAQEAGERAFRDYLDANRSQLQPTLLELGTAAIGDVLGPYSNLNKNYDGRVDRKKRLEDEANKKAKEAAEEALRNLGRDPDADEFRYKQVAPGDGFRLQDLPSLALIVKGSIPFIATQLVDVLGRAAIENASSFTESALNPKSSTMDIASKSFMGMGFMGSDIPLNLGPKMFEKLLSLTEEIANNTAQELMPFSPDLMVADIDKQMRIMEANFQRAETMGPLLAGLIDSRTDLELAMRDARDKIIAAFSPIIVGMNATLTSVIGLLSEEFILKLFTVATQVLPGGSLIQYFWRVGIDKMLESMKKNRAEFQEVEDFFHSGIQLPPNHPQGVPIGI